MKKVAAIFKIKLGYLNPVLKRTNNTTYNKSISKHIIENKG